MYKSHHWSPTGLQSPFSVVHDYNSIHTVLEGKGAHENQNLILLGEKWTDASLAVDYWIREIWRLRLIISKYMLKLQI